VEVSARTSRGGGRRSGVPWWRSALGRAVAEVGARVCRGGGRGGFGRAGRGRRAVVEVSGRTSRGGGRRSDEPWWRSALGRVVAEVSAGEVCESPRPSRGGVPRSSESWWRSALGRVVVEVGARTSGGEVRRSASRGGGRRSDEPWRRSAVESRGGGRRRGQPLRRAAPPRGVSLRGQAVVESDAPACRGEGQRSDGSSWRPAGRGESRGQLSASRVRPGGQHLARSIGDALAPTPPRPHAPPAQT